MSWFSDLWNNFWSTGTTLEGEIPTGENHLENLFKAIAGLIESGVNFIKLLPDILSEILNLFLEIIKYKYEYLIFIEIIILSVALIKFHNNEEGGTGYNRIIQIFSKIIKYHYDLINFVIYGFMNVFTIIFNIIKSIRG